MPVKDLNEQLSLVGLGDDPTGVVAKRVVLYDTAGAAIVTANGLKVQGSAATGADVAGNPVYVGGLDTGGDARPLLVDTAGRQLVAGAAADGAAVAGNPVLVAGQDGTNAQSILTDSTGRQVVVGAAVDGAAVAGNPVLIGGQDGTNAQSLLTDTSGRLIVGNEGTKTTYSCAFSVVPAAAATDIAAIGGSASKTIRILRIHVSGACTAGVGYSLSLIKRGAADSGGTSSAGTVVPNDSGSAAGTGTVTIYTANPTLNNTVGSVRRSYGAQATFTAAVVGIPIDWDFADRPGQALVLRGTAEQACINYEGQTNAGNVLYCHVEWTEE